MKIRNDYVTNSSSSSFIVGFKSENDIDSQLKESMFKCDSIYRYDEVLRDIKNHRITKEYALEIFKDEVKWEVEFYFQYEYERKLGLDSIISFYDWLEDETNKKAFDEAVSAKVDELYKEYEEKINACEYLAEVEYCDHTDGDLEHEIMPYLDCTIKHFSHH